MKDYTTFDKTGRLHYFEKIIGTEPAFFENENFIILEGDFRDSYIEGGVVKENLDYDISEVFSNNTLTFLNRELFDTLIINDECYMISDITDNNFIVTFTESGEYNIKIKFFKYKEKTFKIII